MPGQPNILFIFTDQHRLSAVGAYGPTPCQTPNIDRLAREGVLFENAYTVCPVCSPARASVLTGVYPHTHGVTSNVGNPGCSVHELADRPELLSRRLEAAGYGLGYSGKWHLGTGQDPLFCAPNRPSLPRDIGFEGHQFPGHGGGGFNYPEYRQWLADRGYAHRVAEPLVDDPGLLIAGCLEGPTESTVPWYLADNSIALMDSFRSRRRPFFVWHNFWGPHGPYYPTREYLDMYRDVEIPPWPNYEWPARSIPGPHHHKLHPRHEEMPWSEWENILRHYYAFTTMIDAQIGRMIDYLEETGLIDNTVIVFSADHGETTGSHGGLTDKGWHHFEETHRVPLVVRMPGAAHAGARRAPYAQTTDFYPTFLEIAAAPCDIEPIHGRSLLPIVAGRETPWRDAAVTEFHGVNCVSMTQRTIRAGDLKYGYNVAGGDELYDLAADPWETVNRIDDPAYAEAAADMRARLYGWMLETRDPARGMYRLSRARVQRNRWPDEANTRA